LSYNKLCIFPKRIARLRAAEAANSTRGPGGVVFVNPETEPHQLDVELSPLIVKGTSPVILEVSTQGGQRQHSVPKISLTIPALDMLFLELTGG
jgi:hypothetical protein